MAVFVRVRDGREARLAKYAFCKKNGVNRNMATRMKDWRWAKIFRFFHIENKKVWDMVYTTGQNHLKAISRESLND